jgi:zinc transporter ZupT
LLAILLTVFASGGAVAGVLLGQTRGLPPRIAAAGGGLLFGISIFWMLPEMAEQSGWAGATLSLTLGAVVLWSIDHYVYPICPSCSHEHDHHHCAKPPLHGFAPPILIATGIHSILDGWSVRMMTQSGVAGLAIPIGLALHKLPEGLAVGLIAREAMNSTRRAMVACILAEGLTMVGAWIEPIADGAGAYRFGPLWVTGVLALIGGSFLFLGFHTVHGSRSKPGVVSTFILTLTATAGVALVHWRYGGF